MSALVRSGEDDQVQATVHVRFASKADKSADVLLRLLSANRWGNRPASLRIAEN